MSLTIALLFPELLGTYGDGGNALVLAKRATWRGIRADVIEVSPTDPVPHADIYVIGGGEDGPQAHAASILRADGTLVHALDSGAVLLAVCAGFQIMGESFEGPDGVPIEGVGVFDAVAKRSKNKRAVGEVLATSSPDLDVGLLSGFENHGGRTTLGPHAVPMGCVQVGIGNGADDGSQLGFEGAWAKKRIGTYLHGPILARNHRLADQLLAWATGDDLVPLDDSEVDSLREIRCAAVKKQEKRWRLS
jgi:CobQ-like glutamine amidotransferase family enzyme